MLLIATIALYSFIAFQLSGVTASSMGSEFYSLLEVSPQAELSEIKKAYRKLSKKYHPDKNRGDEEAADHYKKINRAYEVLSNEELREIYDQGGEDGLEKFEQGQGKIKKGPNARADIQLTLEDLYKGTQRTMNLNRNVYCAKCKGTGAKDGNMKQCTKCHGRGTVVQNVQMGFGMQV